MGVDKYCQIVARSTEDISVLWKGFHIVCLLIATVCSFMTAIDMVTVLDAFGRNCILFAKLNFSNITEYETAGEIPSQLSFHNSFTIWGSETSCSYCKCTYLFSMIIALIMMAFFVIFPKGGYSHRDSVYSSGWIIVPWAIISSTILTICLAVAYKLVKDGLVSFTDQLQLRLHESGCKGDECENYDLFTLVFNEETIEIKNLMQLLAWTPLIGLVAWIVLIVSLILRIIFGIDFRIIIYHITPTTKYVDSGSSISSTSIGKDADIQPSLKLLKGQVIKENDGVNETKI